MKRIIKKLILGGIGYIVIKWAILLSAGAGLIAAGRWSPYYLLILPVIGIPMAFFWRRRLKRYREEVADSGKDRGEEE